MCRRLSNSSDGSGVSSTSSLSELWGPDQQERRISGHEPLAVLPEDQDNYAADLSRRTSNNSDYSFSGYSKDYSENQLGDHESSNSNFFLFPKYFDRRSSGVSSEYERNQSRLSLASDRQSSYLSADYNRCNSSLSAYSDRRSSGYTSDFSDRRVSLEDRSSVSPSFLKSPSINSKDLYIDGRREVKKPRMSIDESKDQVEAETIKPGMRNVPDWLKSLRLHKYTNLIMRMDYEDMLELTEDKLEKMKVTKGAARKITNSIQKLKERSQLLQAINENVENGATDLKKILTDLEFILRSPTKIEDRDNKNTALEIEITNDGNALITQIMVTMRVVCSNLLLSTTTEQKNGKHIDKDFDLFFFNFFVLF
jgi:hypothetical protein